MSTLAWVVIPKAGHYIVPEGAEHLNKKIFTKRNPDVVDDKVTAEKVLHPQRGCGCRNGFGMLGQAVVEYRPR